MTATCTRGSVVKEASADTILAVLGERDPETNVMEDTRIVLHKQRSGPQGEEFPFAARLVDMGADRDGEPLTSRVIDWLDERPEKPKEEERKRLPKPTPRPFPSPGRALQPPPPEGASS